MVQKVVPSNGNLLLHSNIGHEDNIRVSYDQQKEI